MKLFFLDRFSKLSICYSRYWMSWSLRLTSSSSLSILSWVSSRLASIFSIAVSRVWICWILVSEEACLFWISVSLARIVFCVSSTFLISCSVPGPGFDSSPERDNRRSARVKQSTNTNSICGHGNTIINWLSLRKQCILPLTRTNKGTVGYIVTTVLCPLAPTEDAGCFYTKGEGSGVIAARCQCWGAQQGCAEDV